MMKTCTKCGENKPATLEYFFRDTKTKDNLCCQCKTCRTKAVLAYRETKRGQEIYKKIYKKQNQSKSGKLNSRKSHLKTHYSITLEQYDEMFKEQNGICIICGKPETRTLYNTITHLVVDHNHETGKIRGLLCHNCNILIGCAKDNITMLQSAINYLHREKENEKC